MDVIVINPKRYDLNYKKIDGSLESLQELVDGYIEPCAPVELRDQGIELLANEEGLLKGLELNENFEPFFLVGTVVAVGIGDEDFISLTADQTHFLAYWLFKLERDNLGL